MTCEAAAGWRFYLFNWIVVGAMAAALALKLMSANVSLELACLAVAVGYVGLCEGLADGPARSTLRGDPRLLFMLGGVAQVFLIAAIMAPLAPPAASAVALAQNTAVLSAGAFVRWLVFAVPAALAMVGAFRRVEEFTFAFALASTAAVILAAFLPATDGRLLVAANPTIILAALCAWALLPFGALRPLGILAFAVALASSFSVGGRDVVGVAGGIVVAALAIAAARGLGRILARRQSGATAATIPGAVPAD